MNRINQGFTLIEVLVAMLVLAIGLLGLAGLQMKSLNATQETYFQTQSDMLVNDLIIRIRANKTATYTLTDQSITSKLTKPAKLCGKIEATDTPVVCNAAELATWDWYAWATDANRVLVNKNALIDVSRTGNLYQITLKADIFSMGVTGTDCSGKETVDMYCFRLTANIE